MKIGNYVKYLCYSDGHLIIGPIKEIFTNGMLCVLSDDGCMDIITVNEVLDFATDGEAMLAKLENL